MLYNTLYIQADQYAAENLKDEELCYFYDVTDSRSLNKDCGCRTGKPLPSKQIPQLSLRDGCGIRYFMSRVTLLYCRITGG